MTPREKAQTPKAVIYRRYSRTPPHRTPPPKDPSLALSRRSENPPGLNNSRWTIVSTGLRQLFNDGRRWWVMNIMWDAERPGLTLPEEYLKSE